MTELLEENAPVSAGEDDVRQFLNEIRRYPRLTPEEERALAQRCAQGDEDAIRMAFSPDAKNNVVFLPHVMSRKKQVIPALSAMWG